MRERGAGTVARGAGATVGQAFQPVRASWKACPTVGQAFQPVRTAWKGCPTTFPPASSKNSKITKEILRFGSAQGAGAKAFRPAVVIIRQLLDKALAEALQAVRSKDAAVQATSLAKLFGFCYAMSIQTQPKTFQSCAKTFQSCDKTFQSCDKGCSIMRQNVAEVDCLPYWYVSRNIIAIGHLFESDGLDRAHTAHLRPPSPVVRTGNCSRAQYSRTVRQRDG